MYINDTDEVLPAWKLQKTIKYKSFDLVLNSAARRFEQNPLVNPRAPEGSALYFYVFSLILRYSPICKTEI